MPRAKSTRGMDGLPASRDGLARMECRGKAKQGTPCGIGPCPMKRALGVRGLEGVRFLGEAPMPRGKSTRGMDGLGPAGEASPAWSAGGKPKQGTPCGIGPCPMKRALGVREFGRRSFPRGSPDATGEEHAGHGWPLASRGGFARMECRGKAKAGHSLWHRALPDEESLGGARVWSAFVSSGKPRCHEGEGVRGMDGLRPAWMASPAWSAGGKPKRGTPCGFGPCPMKRALGVRKARGRSFPRGSPDATSEEHSGHGWPPSQQGWLRPQGVQGGRQSGALPVASGLAR